MYNSWKVNSFNRHNVTNCFTYAGDLAGSSSLEKSNANLLLHTYPSTLLVCAPITLLSYVPPWTLLLYIPLELYSDTHPLELYFCATMYASRDWRTCTVSGAWDLSGICFASFMVSPGKVLGSKLPLGFNRFSPNVPTSSYGSEECEQYGVRG